MVEDLEVFSNELSESLKQVELPDNLTQSQRLAINVFKDRKNVMYFKADKGSGVCLLNPCFYKLKVLQILETDKYERLPRNVDYFVNLKFRRFTNKFPFLSDSPGSLSTIPVSG